MLYVTEKTAKLGGVYLPGQVVSIEIQSSANIYTQQNKKGKITKMQPSGYEQAKVTIEIVLEATSSKSVDAQLKSIQSLFRAHKQKNAKKMKIVNSQCKSSGISQVYFKGIISVQEISYSKMSVSLELWAPKIAGIKVKKKKSAKKTTKKKKTKKNLNKSPAKDTQSTADGKKKASGLTAK